MGPLVVKTYRDEAKPEWKGISSEGTMSPINAFWVILTKYSQKSYICLVILLTAY